MSRAKVAGYSRAQIILHWTVAILIISQFLVHDSMEAAWRAMRRGEAVPADAVSGANVHAAVGLAILVLAIARLWLRFTRGAPAPPSGEPAPLRFLAQAIHVLLYALIVLIPIGGAVAWFLGVAQAGGIHGLAANVLFWVALLHVAGALYQQFIARTDVLMRMLRP